MAKRTWHTKKCIGCGCAFDFRAYLVELKARRFCTKACANKHNPDTARRRGKQIPWLVSRTPWNKGMPMRPDELAAYRKRQCGPNHHWWRGGISREKYRLRRSPAWALWRTAVFTRDNHTCRRCRKRGGELVPHHIKLFSYYPKYRFDVSNGVTVCRKCHLHIHRAENQGKKIINIHD